MLWSKAAVAALLINRDPAIPLPVDEDLEEGASDEMEMEGL